MTEKDKPLVLVADDEIHTTLMLQHLFEREGFNVERANNGEEAFQLAKQLQPDLILLDILMPRMNGFQVLEHLRKETLTTNIPVIMITANAREPADVARGLNLGADDYIYKPFAPQELLARSKSKIKARQLEDALTRRTNELQALLQTSDVLNQHLSVSELDVLIPRLLVQLMKADYAAIYRIVDDNITYNYILDEDLSVDASKLYLDANHIENILFKIEPILWQPNEESLIPIFDSGIAIQLRHSESSLGVLLIGRKNIPYDNSDYILFMGIARQAAMALHNATLYELELLHAQTLEERVRQRTAELESAQKLLFRSEKLASIGHLAASIAHEINNPLMPIRTLLDEIIEDFEIQNISYDQRAIEIIRESIERIRGIVSRLLEFARDSSPNMQMLDMSILIQNILKLNQRFFELEGVKTEMSLPSLPPVWGSKDQLEQVFMNLALNAKAAMDKGGILKVSAMATQTHIIITFTDTGCGIPQDKLDKIFDPFYSTKPNGTGLGLFVSYGIIEGHHGTIEVSSQLGAGTEFRISLPLYEEEQI